MKTIEHSDLYTIDGRTLHMTIRHITNDSVEVCLTNLSYKKCRNTYLNRLLFLLIAYGWFIFLFPRTMLMIHIAFLAITAIHIHILVGLVQCEKLIFVRDFCLQSCGEYFMGRKTHLFLSTTNIHDIVINEVIYGAKVIYVMVVLTSGKEYTNQPIIPLLTNLNPSVNCIEILYNLFQNMLEKG